MEKVYGDWERERRVWKRDNGKGEVEEGRLYYSSSGIWFTS